VWWHEKAQVGIDLFGVKAHGDLMCAVNVPYGHNWPSTSSHFCNLGNTFRASVIGGQTVDLLRQELILRDSRLLTTNQKAGSSNLSGRAILNLPFLSSAYEHTLLIDFQKMGS
jgi:hypothetical protein